MKITRFFFLLFCFFSNNILFAQISSEEENAFLLGFHVGRNYLHNGISNIPQAIIPDIYSENTYKTTNIKKFGFTGGVNAEFRPRDYFAVGSGVSFSKRAGGYQYEDIEGLEYDMNFNYWYTGLDIYTKLIFKGAYAKLGFQTSLNIQSENIRYQHSPETLYGSSLAVQQELRQVLKGKPDMGFVGGLGYEYEFQETKNGMFIDVSYYYGLGDIIQTNANGYGFIDTDNRVQSAQVTLGFLFTLNESNR
jgi:hypothetical protein